MLREDRLPGDNLVVVVRGFTLVELLVVIAIIIVLAATMFPVYETATKRAERAVCIVNIRHIAVATRLYADDFDGFCVPARVSGPGRNYGICWDTLLQPYLRSTLILVCASDPLPMPTSGSVSFKHSYGINYDVALIGGYNGAALPFGDIERPAQTVLFFDIRGAARAMGTSARLHGLSRVDARHGEGANFAFAAGNVKWHRPERTLAPKDCSTSENMWAP